jgi:hypothetical protein
VANFLLRMRENRSKEEQSRVPKSQADFGLSLEQIRKALSKVTSNAPPTPKAGPALSASTDRALRPTPEPTALTTIPKPKQGGNQPIASIVDDRENPSLGGSNPGIGPHEIRTLAQVSQSTHISGGKCSGARGENRTG